LLPGCHSSARFGVCGPDAATYAPIMTALESLDWTAIHKSVSNKGWAITGPVLSADECACLRQMYTDEARFRSRVDMARHRFGQGEYKYFANPMPTMVSELRRQSYARLAPIANEWHVALGVAQAYPTAHEDFIKTCLAAKQTRPTPLLLKYATGGYNCLHQDIYGAVAFPLQLVVMLSRPGADYDGGSFLLVENRPRAQSAGEALLPKQGEAVIFTTRTRVVHGARTYRTTVRHGVSTVTRGERYTLGIIYHDAE
jgi:hypothetical protein